MERGIEKRIERDKTFEYSVHEETAKLDTVMMWGSPGTEAVLGQLISPSISCFYTNFNVPEARVEFENAKSLVEKRGIEVLSVQDVWASQIEKNGTLPSVSLDQLKSKLRTRGEMYYEQYKDGDDKISDLSVLDWMDPILEEDVERYGEKVAIVMNEKLSLSEQLPLSNVIYARDQSNLIGSTWIWSSMRHEIRQPEVDLYKQILTTHGMAKNSSVQVSNSGLFEGGDGIVNDNTAYFGAGGRSNLTGIVQIAKEVIRNDGLKVAVVYDEKRDKGEQNEMEAMHLDTFWMPSGLNEVVACPTEVKRRRVFELGPDSEDNIVTTGTGWFMDHLEERDIDFIPISNDEQKSHASNFLNLGENEIILSLPIGGSLEKELVERDKTIFNADLVNITKGYGGLHCMTAALRRW